MLNDLKCDNKLVGALLRDARVHLGYSLRELAKSSGVSPSQILRVESGEFDCNLATLIKLCGALALRPGLLFEACVEVNREGYFEVGKNEYLSTYCPPYVQKLNKYDLGLLRSYGAGLACHLALILRSSRPVTLAGLFEYPVAAQSPVFVAYAEQLQAKGLYVSDRLELLLGVQSGPVTEVARLQLLTKEMFSQFKAIWETAPHNGLPYLPESGRIALIGLPPETKASARRR